MELLSDILNQENLTNVTLVEEEKESARESSAENKVVVKITMNDDLILLIRVMREEAKQNSEELKKNMKN